MDEKTDFCRVYWMNWCWLGGEGCRGDGIVTNRRYEPILLNTEGDRQSQMIVPGPLHDDLVGEEYYAGRSGDGTD